jgi:amino acid permease
LLTGNRYAYSISFTTLIIAAADLTTFWNWAEIGRQFVFIVGAPVVLGAVNCLGVLWYGNVEAFAGVIKVILVFVAFCAMCVINHLGTSGRLNAILYRKLTLSQ